MFDTDPAAGFAGYSVGTFTDEDVEIRRLHGRAVVLPRSLSRLRGDALEAICELQQHVLKIRELEGGLLARVADARESGASWHAVGWSVGTTGEAARQRWSEHV